MSETPRLSQMLVHTATMLVTNELGRAMAFYRDQFGFAIQYQEEGIALLELGPMLLYLVTESPPTPDKPSMSLANTNTEARTSVKLVFRVSDCWAVYEDLRQRGVAFLAPPQQPAWGGWRCFTRDPDGYLIEIEQP